ELLKEIVPRLSRVAVFGTSINSGNAQTLREVELTAKAFGVKLQYLDVLSPKDIETAFRAASKGRADAVLMLPGSVLVLQRAQLADLAAKNRAPGDLPTTRLYGSRRTRVLWREHRRLVPTRCHVCGQDFERRQAG